MKILKFPFLSLSVFFALGILSYPFFDVSIYFWIPILLIVFGGLLILYIKIISSYFFRSFYFLFIAICFWILGILTISIHSTELQKQHYSNYTIQDKKQFLEITIREELKSNNFSKKYIGDLLKVDTKNTHGIILIVAPFKDSLPCFLAGQNIVSYGNITPINSSLNPYQFDYKNYMDKKGVKGQLYLGKHNFETKQVDLNSRFIISSFRNKLINSFEIHNFSPDVFEIVKALLFGQRQGLSDELKNDYRQLGVIHVLAISGLHVGIIYLFLVMFLNQFGLLPKYKYIIVILFLWFFAILSGLSPSVVRAVCMFSLFALSFILGRTQFNYNTLAVSFFLMLCFNPYYIYDVGFQLSYMAVFSIVFFMPIFKNFIYSRFIIWRYLKTLIAVSLSAQIGVLPLVIYNFHQIPVFFMFGNLVVIPAVTLILILLLILLMFNFISHPIALIFGKIVSFFIEIMNSYVHYFSRFSNYNIQDISFNRVLAVFLAITLFIIGFSLKTKKNKFAIVALLSLLFFQIIYIFSSITEKENNEILLLYDKQYPKLLIKDTDIVTIYSTDINALESTVIRDYCRERFISKKRFLPLNSTLEIAGTRILIVDSLGSYETNLKADVILFCQNPKINFERVLVYHEPKLVLTAGNFPNWESKRLNTVCIKKNIPFNSLAEKGYYKFNF